MPIVYHKTLASGWIALWRISESAQALSRLVCDDDAAHAEGFKSESRRCEWLAWRALVAELLDGARVRYDHLGAPILVANDGFIGVSHEKEFVAVIYSSKQRCAVDIENADRNFGRVVERYVSQAESEIPNSGHKWFNAAVWCAKETLYKSADRVGLELLSDIRVESVDFDRELIRGCVKEREIVDLSMFTFENRLIVYTLLK